MTRLFSLSLSVALLSLGCRGEPKEPEETGGADTGDLIDADGDGSPASEDCDDLDAASFPGAEEVCDGVDNDCDGVADENVQSTFYQDADGDGYGNALASVEACEAGVGFADNPHDCNDLDDATHPDTQEVCDGTDNDCDGAIDEPDAADASTWFQDADGDGWGTDNTSTTACNAPVGYVLHGGDCDDADPAFHPGALEADCTDASDYNCDGSVGFEDADSDGYAACEDCDDTLAAVNEAATEVCDSIDNDCDGTADEDDAADAVTWYGDSDGDGHGGTTFQVIACTAPVGYVTSSDDCDDLDASSYPGASESCDTADNDCDGQVDEGVELTFYADADGDGYGDSSQPTQSCTQPPGYSANGDDCNDGEPSARPGGLEICDGLDNDCDGTVDDNALDGSTWYPDADGDGYGDSSGGVSSCAPLSGYIADGTDCDDTSAALSPADGDSDGASSCDGDCDDADATQNLQDADSDGYSTCDGDCLDTDSSANPGATEICDGIDNNCDGSTDEGALGLAASCPASDCATLLLDDPSLGSGDYWVDPDGTGSPVEVSCDMSTDSGGWTLVFHIYDHSGMSEDQFRSQFGHGLFTDEAWTLSGGSLSSGLAGGLTTLGGQGALDIGRMSGLWDDVRMTCSQSSGDATEEEFAQVNGYATTNGSSALLAAATNGVSYAVDAGLNSFSQSTIWHDNETTTQNSSHYLCDYTNSGSSGTSQFSFCYTDFLNNDNSQDPGDTIVGISFGHQSGSDGWSNGFSGECGNMTWGYLSDTGTFSIWVR